MSKLQHSVKSTKMKLNNFPDKINASPALNLVALSLLSSLIIVSCNCDITRRQEEKFASNNDNELNRFQSLEDGSDLLNQNGQKLILKPESLFDESLASRNMRQLMRDSSSLISAPSRHKRSTMATSGASLSSKEQASQSSHKPASSAPLVDACPSRMEVITPYYATNSKGKLRTLVHSELMQQAIQVEICQRNNLISMDQKRRDNILKKESTPPTMTYDDDDTDVDIPSEILDDPSMELPIRKFSRSRIKSEDVIYLSDDTSSGTDITDECVDIEESKEGSETPFVPDPGAGTSHQVEMIPSCSVTPVNQVTNQPSQNVQEEEEEEDEEAKEELKKKMKSFVDLIFTDCLSITVQMKAEFGALAQRKDARLLFAMFVDEHRVVSQRVSELTFYSLAQHFSIVLLECLLAEDFRPAKMIMNMMFTYYHEHSPDQPIIMRPDDQSPRTPPAGPSAGPRAGPSNPGPSPRPYRPRTPPPPAPSAEVSLLLSVDSGRPSCSPPSVSSSISISQSSGSNILNRLGIRIRNSPANSISTASSASSMFGSRHGQSTAGSVSPTQLSPRSTSESIARRQGIAPAGVFANIAEYLHLLEIHPEMVAAQRDNEREQESSSNNLVRTYLYTLLKDQEIFTNLRFWQSAFYESIVSERNNHPLFRQQREQVDKMNNEQRAEEQDLSRNITFGLLSSFIHNMINLELNRDFCQQFLDKHSTIGDLSEEQMAMLKSLIN